MTDEQPTVEIEYTGDGDSARTCISCGETHQTKEGLVDHYETYPDHRTVSFDVNGPAEPRIAFPTEEWVVYDDVLRDFVRLDADATEDEVTVEYDELMEYVVISVGNTVVEMLDTEGYAVDGDLVWEWDDPYVLVQVDRA